MNLTDEIKYYADPDALVIWWEKPEEAELIDVYELRLNGKPAAVTKKTCYRFDTGIKSDTEYTVQVSVKNAEGLLLDDVTVHISTPSVPRYIDVTESPYFAAGDGVTKNTEALQRAIDDCPEGGVVYVPPGTFLSGALTLHSNMKLYLAEKAVLLGSSDEADYLPAVGGRFNGTECECFKSLINMGSMRHDEGPDCRNITICGKGTIKGGIVRPAGDTLERAEFPGCLITASNCSDVRISGLTLSGGPAANMHVIYSLNVTADHCIFRSDGIKGLKGFIVDSSEHCTLSASEFITDGDCVAVKSGKNPEGGIIARPSRNIRVFDCRAITGEGICIGPEISGGIENVKIWDCDLERSVFGIQVKTTKDMGGYVRGLRVSDCIAPSFRVVLTDYDDDMLPSPCMADLQNFLCERLKLTGIRYMNGEWRECRSVEVEGFNEEHPVQNVLLQDIDISGGLGIHTEFCKNLRFEGGRR